MAQSTTTIELLSQTVYGVPSGNYDGSSLDFRGNRQEAADFYKVSHGVQTVRYNLDDFQGELTIQATLDDNPSIEDPNWFDVYTLPSDSSAITTYSSANIIGNFTWMRVKISNFTGGTINFVTLVY